MEQLKSSHLLMLGCNFPDWIARLMLRTAKGTRLSSHRDALEVLVDEHPQGRTPSQKPTRSNLDPALVMFLRSFSTQTIVLDQSASRFIDTLAEKMNERTHRTNSHVATVHVSPPPRMPKGSIFISYSREDLAAVQILKANLAAAGLPVWFDMDQLQAGDAWEERIIDNIQNCSLFIPVISRQTELRLKDAYFRKEWYYAEQRDMRNAEAVRFILPVLLDLESAELNAVPRRFLTKQLTSLPGGKATPQFIQELTTLLPAS
jgi:hypothetical protein